ncbi:tetratricopeptide repeat protein [Botrimarina colliarenosi]|uniref:Tetratricopeptide repeat protein n=1 Tax=Botrimarina colliarenosi TaxID=2528001 RepID=A0A5C6ABW5_9BACT|nr:hypothetical protein [Botrimarina colliarenosi]TWT96808.1 tetratricopeptide repeat protein [Botrimarina colliarenosi]
MPYTVNGIGTNYYGKQNLEKHQGVCGSCGREVELKSYDTRLCFCVLYIPLIPLGKKRVVDDCPACRRHHVLNHSVWEEQRGKAIREAVAAYEAAPDDIEKAIAMHATLASAGERAAAAKMVETLSERFPENADVQVYLGNSLEEIGETQRSNERFHLAYQADSTNPLAQHASAVAFLREGKPEEARKRLDEFEKGGGQVAPAILFALATEFEKQNDPATAAELLRRVSDVAPNARKEKGFRQLAKKVEETTGERPGTLAAPVGWWENRAVWVGAGAVAIAAALFAYDAHVAGSLTYVVNGLPKPISVAVDDGESSRILPGRWSVLKLPVGEHVARVVDPPEHAGETPFSVNPGRFSRWLRKPATVVDPTRSAMVLYEETVYSEVPVDRDNAFEVVIGEPSHTFDNADYHFVDFPAEIEIDREEVTKSRVGMVEIDPEVLFFNFPDQLERPEVLDFIESHLLAVDESEDLLGVYFGALTEHDALARGEAFLAARLDHQPIDVEWHRFYQRLAELNGQRDLPARYDGLLKMSPEDPDLMYLRARLESYADRSRPLYERALEVDADHVMTLLGKAYMEMATGDFGAALEATDRVLTVEPENFRAVQMRRRLLAGVDRRDELERELQTAIAESPLNLLATELMMASEAARGDLDAARQSQQAFAAKVAEEWPKDPYQLNVLTQVLLLRLEGDYPAAIEAATTLTDQARRAGVMQVNALLSGDTATAAELTGDLEAINQPDAWLWTCLAAATAGDSDAAEYRRQAVEAYSKQGGTFGEIGRLLAGDLPEKELALRAYFLEAEPDLKAALLLLTADRTEMYSGRLVELAERLILLPGDKTPLLEAAIAARKS